jgi:hypothetical protein
MKDRFALWIAVSCGIHALACVPFLGLFAPGPGHGPAAAGYRAELKTAEEQKREYFDSLVSPYLGDTLADSLWRADSSYLKDFLARAGNYRLDDLYDSAAAGGRWSNGDLLLALLHLFGEVRPPDSLLARSELVRAAALRNIMRAMESAADRAGLDAKRIDWEKYMDRLIERLNGPDFSGRSGREAADAARGRLQEVLRSARMRAMWRKALMFSLRETARERLRAAVEQAVRRCLANACGAGPCIKKGSGGSGEGGGEGDGAGKKDGHAKGTFIGGKGEGKMALEAPGFGPGGSFAGIGNIQGPELEKCLGWTLNSGNGAALRMMASLFPRDELVEYLAAVARRAAAEAGAGTGREWAGEDSSGNGTHGQADYESVLSAFFSDSGAGTGRYTGKAQRAIDDFFQSIGQSLGEEIARMMRAGPSGASLALNPRYYHHYAEQYWNLLLYSASTPNLLMPNIDKYADAARKMRSRGLPDAQRLGFGPDTTPVLLSEHFPVPERLFLPGGIALPEAKSPPAALVSAGTFTLAWGGAPRRVKEVVIDGVLEEWDAARPYRLCGTAQGSDRIPGRPGPPEYLFTMWDNQGLYFAYEIRDARDNPHAAEIFWAADALEIFIDPQNFKDSVRIENRSYQFWVWPRCRRKEGCAGQSVFSSPYAFKPRILREGLVRFASRRKGDHYTCEVFLPAALCGPWLPLPGKTIGFNFSINDGEDVYIRWVTNMGENVSIRPNLWGDLLLMGTDARILCAPEKSISAGQNLKITVVDPDMNFHPRTREKVWVTVKSRLTGDALPVCLGETGENSPVFSDSVGTVFGSGPVEEGRLSVRPADTLEVFYLDQYGSGGKKRTPLTARVLTGRAVFAFERR